MKVAFCESNPASVELDNQLLTTILIFFVYEPKCHFRIFFIKRCRFHVALPRDYKKHSAGRRKFSVASHLKTRIHIILHCKTFIPITYMTISFTSACRVRVPFDRCFVKHPCFLIGLRSPHQACNEAGYCLSTITPNDYRSRTIPLGLLTAFFLLHRV